MALPAPWRRHGGAHRGAAAGRPGGGGGAAAGGDPQLVTWWGWATWRASMGDPPWFIDVYRMGTSWNIPRMIRMEHDWDPHINGWVFEDIHGKIGDG